MTITASKIAACGGMSEDTRRRWVDVHGLLNAGPEFTEHDAIETGVAAALSSRTTTQRAPEVFREFRPRLRKEVLVGRTNIWLVVRAKVGLDVTFSPAAAAKAAERRGELTWTISLHDVIQDARDRYAGCLGFEEADIRELRPAQQESGG